jgi:NADH dehydrogenase
MAIFMRRRHRAAPDAPRVVIIGAGFAGLAAVRGLTRAGLRVAIVDRNIYSTFQPLLYQVATGGLNPGDVAYPVRGFTHKYGAAFRRGTLASVDTAARRVLLADGGSLEYDYLVIATGVSAAYYGVKGAAEHTFGLYTRRDAIILRDHVMDSLERLTIADPSRQLSITVVGGGATGVELSGTLAELRSTALDAAFPEVDAGRVNVRLVEMGPDLIGNFDPKLRAYTLAQLDRRGVDVHVNTTIREVTADRVLLADGRELPSDLTVWAAGVAGPPEASRWNLPLGRGGRIVVRPDLRVKGHDQIFAIGDIALVEENPLPQLSPPAMQGGRHVGVQIPRLVAGQETVPFSYHDKGIMATIGRKAAVVQLPYGLRIRGTLAWLAWLVLHLFYLLGGRNRFGALVNLSWRYIAWGHGGGVIVGDDPVSSPHDDPVLTPHDHPVASPQLPGAGEEQNGS